MRPTRPCPGKHWISTPPFKSKSLIIPITVFILFVATLVLIVRTNRAKVKKES